MDVPHHSWSCSQWGSMSDWWLSVELPQTQKSHYPSKKEVLISRTSKHRIWGGKWSLKLKLEWILKKMQLPLFFFGWLQQPQPKHNKMVIVTYCKLYHTNNSKIRSINVIFTEVTFLKADAADHQLSPDPPVMQLLSHLVHDPCPPAWLAWWLPLSSTFTPAAQPAKSSQGLTAWLPPTIPIYTAGNLGFHSIPHLA